MTESMKYYESIRRKYPETVSKDQFYQIAHISKATALHLLQNGLRAQLYTTQRMVHCVLRRLLAGGL